MPRDEPVASRGFVEQGRAEWNRALADETSSERKHRLGSRKVCDGLQPHQMTRTGPTSTQVLTIQCVDQRMRFTPRQHRRDDLEARRHLSILEGRGLYFSLTSVRLASERTRGGGPCAGYWCSTGSARTGTSRRLTAISTGQYRNRRSTRRRESRRRASTRSCSAGELTRCSRGSGRRSASTHRRLPIPTMADGSRPTCGTSPSP